MTDERIVNALGALRGAVAPSPEFADDLFRKLSAEIDFARGTVRRRGPFASIAGALSARGRQRLVWFGLIAVLLAALVASLLLVGSLRPVQIVNRSKAFYGHPPAFDITVPIDDVLANSDADAGVIDHLTIRYQYDGSGLIRANILASTESTRPAGSSFIFDGHTYYEFDGQGRYSGAESVVGSDHSPMGNSLFTEGQVADRSWPLQVFPLTWDMRDAFESPQPQVACERPALVGEETVLGRSVNHVECAGGTGLRDYWVDADTGLILRLDDGERHFAATAVDLEPRFGPNVFDIPVGPNGERPLNFGQIDPGTYFTARFRPEMVIRLDRGTWSNAYEDATYAVVSGDGFVLFMNRTDNLLDPTTGRSIAFKGSATDLADWLRRDSDLAVGPESNGPMDGAVLSFDLSVRSTARTVRCENYNSDCVFLAEIPGLRAHIQIARGVHYRILLYEIHGETLLGGVLSEDEGKVTAGLAALQGAIIFP